MPLTLALIHSPLVGPFTWEPVAGVLRSRGVNARVPELANPAVGPFWERHVRSVVEGLGGFDDDARLVLAGHSGAGVLLPAIARDLGRPVAAYLFVDAGLPRGGQPRMEGQFGELLRQLYDEGERFPNWTGDDLAGILPDASVRARVLAELRPQPFAFWEEPLPEVDGWPDAPGGYLLFSPAYEDDAAAAARLGWPVRRMSAGHFHMLVEPDAVADLILELLGELGIHIDGNRPSGQ